MRYRDRIEAVHVGLHKTGSTWLQLLFFPKLPVTILSNELISGIPEYHTLKDMLDVDERYYYTDCIREQLGDVKIILGF